MQASLKIVIVDENPSRAAVLEDALREAGHTYVVCLGETSHLIARVNAIDPDAILIDLEKPRREVLEQMFEVSRAVKRPIAMFVDESDKASIEAAVDAGVSAYVVGGDAGIDRGLDRGFVALVHEHGDRPLHGAAHLKHLLEHLAARLLEIDQDGVGVDGVDAGDEVRGLAEAYHVRVAGRAQGVL